MVVAYGGGDWRWPPPAAVQLGLPPQIKHPTCSLNHHQTEKKFSSPFGSNTSMFEFSFNKQHFSTRHDFQ